ncbi:hypothetical protein MMC30_004269 [Trapelia coarctata]|nr:hypothetical protein [Trapelia coarctata]
MSQSQLPLQFRVAIRDSWENADSPIQKALKELGDEIGIPISIQFQWPMLWDQLGKHFPDKSIFVPTINSLISAWQQALKAKLDEEDDTDWSEEFLEAIKGQSSFVLSPPKPNTEPRPALARHKPTSSLILKIPSSAPPYTPNPTAIFNTQLLTLFSPLSSDKPELDDEWADVTYTPSGLKIPPPNPATNASPLPTLATLPRPELLFPTIAPYHLILRQTAGDIMIEGSHQPSLELLCAYLKKWQKTAPQNSGQPKYQITLRESVYGLGVLYDALFIDASLTWQDRIPMNPVLIIAFVEHVLKYQMVTKPMGMDGMYFRREEAFA